LEDFGYTFQASLNRQKIAHLAESTVPSKAENVVFLGPPGVGKTHLAMSLGVKCCQKGISVKFNSAIGWIDRVKNALSHDRLGEELKAINRTKVIIIDELGYIPFDIDGANLFFQLINSRYERGSVIITSNLEFSRWDTTLGNPNVTGAILDRLIHHSEIISMKGESYRMRLRKTQKNNIK
jgi:DNA replication protein DnaC